MIARPAIRASHRNARRAVRGFDADRTTPLHGLAAKQLIERKLRYGSDGARTSNRYRLLLGEDRKLWDPHEVGVVRIRLGCQVAPDTNVMTTDLRRSSVAPHIGANPQRSEQAEEKLGDKQARADESTVPMAVELVGPDAPRAKPLFSELAGVIGQNRCHQAHCPMAHPEGFPTSLTHPLRSCVSRKLAAIDL